MGCVLRSPFSVYDVSGMWGATHYALLDAQGSVRHLRDSGGGVVRSLSYDAWGQVRRATGSAWTRLGYTGEPMGLADGTVYLRARHYQPALGRFLQRDTFAGHMLRPQSLHKYTYAENNPATLTDPSGQCIPSGVPWIGEAGCRPVWDVGAGLAGADLLHRLWHIFENIGLPGAVAGDYINRLRGAPTHEAARIVRDDELAAYVGGAFREVTLAGAGMRLPWAGRAMAGWTWGQETVGSVCGRPVDPASYVVDTLILIVTVRGGPLTIRNLPAIGSGGSSGGLGALPWIEHATLVQVHSGALAGAAAGVRANRLVVLMAQGSGGPDGGDDWERILFSGKNDGQKREMLRMMQNWSKSTFDSIAESVVKHSRSHGWNDNFARYLSDADNFFRNTRGARSSGIRTDGSELLTKRNGEFIILRDGKIVTYGRNN